MNIVIVHLKRSGLTVSPLFKVDRSTVLGNPASHRSDTKAKVLTSSVEDAVSYFAKQMPKLMREKPEAKVAMEEIYQAALVHPTIYIGCWCMDELDPKPKDHLCHCTVVRRACYRRFERESKNG